jgi:putative membrane protein
MEITLMKKYITTLGLFAVLGASCITLSAADSKLGSDDADFVKNAAKGGKSEVELGRLASQKASDPEVKSFAERMIKDHSAANHRLMALASTKGIDVPSGKGLEGDATYVKLKALSGKTFDKAYVNSMVDDHKDDVAEFEKESNEAKDPDVRAFAAKTLPTLRSHLNQIEKIQASYKD